MKKLINKTATCLLLALVLFACKQKTSQTTVNLQKENSANQLQKILINGDSIHYLDIGEGEPVVFVHGNIGDYRTWSGQIDTFATKHRVIAYSRRYAYPNNSVIKDSSDLTVRPHANDLVELIRKLDLGPVHLVGHSWGAYTSIKATIDHPELVKSLVLGEPPIRPLLNNIKGGDTISKNLTEKAIKPAAKAFRNNNPTQGVSLFIGGVMGDSLLFSKAPEHVQTKWLQNSSELGAQLNSESWLDIPPKEIESIEIPVLVLKGEVSPLFLTKIADEIDRLIPNSTLYVVPGASHGLQGENRKDFNQTVLNFISNN